VAGLAILKVGGSVVSHKHRDCTFDEEATRGLAIALRPYVGRLVLVHGTGSFGKPPAREHGFSSGFIEPCAGHLVARIDRRLLELRTRVVETLVSAGIPALGLAAIGHFITRNGVIDVCNVASFQELLLGGLVPVLSGAIVVDVARGFSVLSSDAIAADLAVRLGARRLVFATDVPGVLDDAGGLLPRVGTNFRPERDLEDVSGAMHGKLSAIEPAVHAGVSTVIVDGRHPGRVAAALDGQSVIGTAVLRAEAS
jgi:isopentenyl phosphate kinase